MNIDISTPRALFFDFDETLASNSKPIQQLFAEMYYQFSDHLGTENRDVFFSSLRENARNLWTEMFHHTKSPEQQFVACFAATLGTLDSLLEANTEPLANAMFKSFVELSKTNVALQDGASDVLRILRENGFITGIITNGIEQIQLAKIHALGLQDQVDHIIVSAQARAHKPHIDVFNLALERASIEPNHAWQIGDHALNDVAGAIRAGMSGIFFNPKNDNLKDIFKDIAESPTHTINHLLEIPELVSAL